VSKFVGETTRKELELELAELMGIELPELYAKYIGKHQTLPQLKNWIEWVKAHV